jgi:hypothetical protein
VRQLTTPEGFISAQDYAADVAAGFVDPYSFVSSDSDWITAWDTYKVARLEYFRLKWNREVIGSAADEQAFDDYRQVMESYDLDLRSTLDDGPVGVKVAQGYVNAGINSSEAAEENFSSMAKTHDAAFEAIYHAVTNVNDDLVVSATAAHGFGVRDLLVRAARASAGVFNAAPVISFTGAASVTQVQGTAAPDFMSGVTATDDEDGVIDPSNISVDIGTYDANVVGNYTITYSVSDSEGATSQQTRTFSIVPDVSLITESVINEPTFSNAGATISVSAGRIDVPFDPLLVYQADANGDRYWFTLYSSFERNGLNIGGGTSRTLSWGWNYDAATGTWYSNHTITPSFENNFDNLDIADGDKVSSTVKWVRYNQNSGISEVIHEKTSEYTVTTSGYSYPDISSWTDDLDIRGNRDMAEDNGTVTHKLPWKTKTLSPEGLFDVQLPLPAGHNSRYENVYFTLFTYTDFYRNGEQIAWNGYTRSDSYYADGPYATVWDGSTYWQAKGSGFEMSSMWDGVNTYGFKDGAGNYNHGIQSGDTCTNRYVLFVRYYDAEGNYAESESIEYGTDSVVMS